MSSNQARRLLLQYARSHPGTSTLAIIGGTVAIIGCTSVICGEILDLSQRRSEQRRRDPKDKISIDDARLHAMVKNAKETSWRENLDNAASAQEHFMLPGIPNTYPKFMSKVDNKSVEILKNQHEKIDREKSDEDATIFQK